MAIPIYDRFELQAVGTGVILRIKGLDYLLSPVSSYVQMNDIDMGGEPFPARTFSGVYDGRHHKITGAYDAPLFQELAGALVQNTHIEGEFYHYGHEWEDGWWNAYVSVARACGPIAGRSVNSVIRRCSALGVMHCGQTIPDAYMNGADQIPPCGGLVGLNEGGSIIDSFSRVSLLVEPSYRTYDLVGGIVGRNVGTIQRCYYAGLMEFSSFFIEPYEEQVIVYPSSFSVAPSFRYGRDDPFEFSHDPAYDNPCTCPVAI